jgi:Undecaprenyl-phosphate galactose phosphotransferase WbaP
MSTQSTAVRQVRVSPPPVFPPRGVRGKAGALSAGRITCGAALVVSDLITMTVALELAILVRAHLLPHLPVRAPRETFFLFHYLEHVWVWALLFVFLAAEGLYTQRRTLWNEIGHLTKATGLGLLAVLAAVALGKLTPEVSRVTILVTWFLLLVLLPISRYWSKRALAWLGLWRKPLLVLGAADTAHLVLCGLNQDPVFGYHVIGLLDDDPRKQDRCVGQSYGKPVYVLGPLSLAPALLMGRCALDVLIAMPGLEEVQLIRKVHELQSLCESIYVIPKMWGLPMMNLQVDGLLQQQVLMLKVLNNLAKPWNHWLKRGFDLVVGSALAVLALPVMFVTAVAIKLSSKGPALFVQERLGYRGRPFRCLKFRSMHVNGDDQLHHYLKEHPDLAAEWAKYAKLRSQDPRLTPVGAFLRRWSLDELPQILNVLKGEMSLVGPRPYLPREIDRIGTHLRTILSARPGITGFWQVNGKNEMTLEDRVRVEVWYVRNWCLWLDFIVLAKTFKTVLLREGV